MHGQPLYTIIVRYEVVAPDRATALLTTREHIAGTDYKSITIEKVEEPDKESVDGDTSRV